MNRLKGKSPVLGAAIAAMLAAGMITGCKWETKEAPAVVQEPPIDNAVLVEDMQSFIEALDNTKITVISAEETTPLEESGSDSDEVIGLKTVEALALIVAPPATTETTTEEAALPEVVPLGGIENEEESQ